MLMLMIVGLLGELSEKGNGVELECLTSSFIVGEGKNGLN